MATKLASIVPSGTNQYATPGLGFNRFATDNITPGIIGNIGNASGVGPATGAFGVSAQGSPNMTVAVNSGVAYVTATPTGGTAQTYAVTMDASENVTIAANATGGTRYDFVYIKLDADKLNNPAATATDVVTLATQRSTTQYVDSNGALANGHLIAEVTVANGAASIANASIADRRVGTGFAGLGWSNPPISGTWTYSSADAPTFVITTPTDTTGWCYPGMRVRVRQSGSWLYFIVTVVTATTITVYGGTDYVLANATISQPQFSTMKMPFGFNSDPAKWTVRATDTSDRTQGSPVTGTTYNIGSVTMTVPIGAWVLTGKGSLDITGTDGVGGLSTANNSCSDVDLLNYSVVTTRGTATVFVKKNVTVTVKTPYYAVYKTPNGASSITFRNGSSTFVIEALCGYL